MPITYPIRRTIYAIVLCCSVFLLTSCAAPVASVRAQPVPFDVALDLAVDDLIAQTQRLPAFMTNMESRIKLGTIVVDPLLDSSTGQQNALTKRAEQRVITRIASRFKQFDILPLGVAELRQASYVLTGTLSPTGVEVSDRGQYRISLALAEVKSGLVVAQAAARVNENNLDTNPVPFFRDSPVIAKDRVVEGYIRTAESKPGSFADPVYLERLPTSALVTDATKAYNGDRIQDALTLYEAAAKRPDGQQMKVFNGLYLAHWRMGKREEAENAFGMIVRLAFATNTLSVKFLFKPGSTDFVSDSRVSEPYPIWLRQIARVAAASNQCINVVGHTSRTGTEQVNDRLSLQRAVAVKGKLESENPELAKRLRQTGMGFRENVVGTGTDDLRDALDRRVEFRIVRCDV